MDNNPGIRKNPSRETCESIIKRILITEYLECGTNKHFRHASDFMGYFESLYPASDSLYKQVQRAIRAMDMPKDSQGYFIVNKTTEQLEQENEIKKILKTNGSEVNTLENCEPVLLTVTSSVSQYLIHLLHQCETFKGLFEAIVEVHNGIIIYTKTKDKLIEILDILLK